jgi:hypothetical protein
METTAVNVISRAADCNIKTYIACKFDNNLTSLVVSGKPTLDELFLAFNNIEMEFCDASGTSVPELGTRKRVMELQCRIKSVELYFVAAEHSFILLGEPAQAALDGLRKNGVSLSWPSNDFAKQLKAAQTREKLKHVQLEELLKELEIELTIEKRDRPTHQNNVYHFYSLIHALEANGFRINETETSILRLGIMIRDFSKMVERQKRNN